MTRLALLALALCACSIAPAMAEDIGTVPSANQLKKGEVSLSGYWVDLHSPHGAAQNMSYETLAVGITDRLELGVHHMKIDKDDAATLLVANYKLVSQTATNPDVIVGVRNFTAQPTTIRTSVRDKSSDPSFYVSIAKTYALQKDAPAGPSVRIHMSMGTSDWTILYHKRHEGVFGGFQFRVAPWLAAVALHDGSVWISGLTLIPTKGVALKIGRFDKHDWYSVSLKHQF